MLTGTKRIVLPLSLLLLSIALLAGLWLKQRDPAESFWGRAPAEVQAVLWPERKPIPPFDLNTSRGESFGPGDLEGQWSFIFFGYLQCPDVCPTSLRAIREMRRTLVNANPDARQYQFIFVTVDPDNDQPGRIRKFLDFYEPALIGLHGPTDEIRRLAEPMSVRFMERVDEHGNRTIDHTSSLMIIDPRGRLVGALPAPLEPRSMVEKFARLRDYLGPTGQASPASD